MNPPPRLVLVVATAMMLLALADMPYGYYQLLRLVTFITAGWIAIGLWERGGRVVPIVFGLLALTFNPVFPVHFDRETWAILNVIGAGLFAAALWLDYRANRLTNAEPVEAPRTPRP